MRIERLMIFVESCFSCALLVASLSLHVRYELILGSFRIRFQTSMITFVEGFKSTRMCVHSRFLFFCNLLIERPPKSRPNNPL